MSLPPEWCRRWVATSEDLEMVARGGRLPSRGLLRKMWHEEAEKGEWHSKQK